MVITMVERIDSKNGGKFTIRFCHKAPIGHTVSLAGVFNDWDPAKNAMLHDGEAYCCMIELPPGEYEYKLVVDGEWMLDEDNPNFVSNDFGTLNSVVIVK